MTFLTCFRLIIVTNQRVTLLNPARNSGSRTHLYAIKRLDMTQISARVTRSPTRYVWKRRWELSAVSARFKSSFAFAVAALLNGMMPMQGKTQVQVGGRISFSAKEIHC